MVALALAGLVSMHGLDGAAASLSEPSHTSAEESTGHETLGICVFVLAIAGLGMATPSSTPRQRVTGRYRQTETVPRHPLSSGGGRSRLILLCVLRL